MISDIIDDLGDIIFRSTIFTFRALNGPIKNAASGIFLGIGFAIGAEIVRWAQSL